MSPKTLERPEIFTIESARASRDDEEEPNFGPGDMHTIAVIFGIMVSIFAAALLLYGAIALAAWISS